MRVMFLFLLAHFLPVLVMGNMEHSLSSSRFTGNINYKDNGVVSGTLQNMDISAKSSFSALQDAMADVKDALGTNGSNGNGGPENNLDIRQLPPHLAPRFSVSHPPGIKTSLLESSITETNRNTSTNSNSQNLNLNMWGSQSQALSKMASNTKNSSSSTLPSIPTNVNNNINNDLTASLLQSFASDLSELQALHKKTGWESLDTDFEHARACADKVSNSLLQKNQKSGFETESSKSSSGMLRRESDLSSQSDSSVVTDQTLGNASSGYQREEGFA